LSPPASKITTSCCRQALNPRLNSSSRSNVRETVEPRGEDFGLSDLNHKLIVAYGLHIVNTLAPNPEVELKHKASPSCLLCFAAPKQEGEASGTPEVRPFVIRVSPFFNRR
jgi:hypothetical protein